MSKRRKLPWPMSRIERDVLHSLWMEAKITGQPITEIVATAVNNHVNRERVRPVAPSPWEVPHPKIIAFPQVRTSA